MSSTVWRPITGPLPDAEMTVLVYVPAADDPIWLGFTDGEAWFWVDGSEIDQKVTHWAHLPEPPE